MDLIEKYINELQAEIQKAYDEANANGEFAEGVYRGLRRASRLLSEVISESINQEENESDSAK